MYLNIPAKHGFNYEGVSKHFIPKCDTVSHVLNMFYLEGGTHKFGHKIEAVSGSSFEAVLNKE